MSSECLLLIAHYIRAIDLTFDKNDSILRRTMDAFLSGIPLKELDWKGSAGKYSLGNLDTITCVLELREFVTNTDWLDERGQPFADPMKRNFLSKMNDDSISDVARISYTWDSDLVELWYTKLQPFSEFSCWARVPGIRRKALDFQMQHQAVILERIAALQRSD